MPTDTSYDLTFDAPGSYFYLNLALNNAIPLSLLPTALGQTVTMTAVAASGVRFTHTFTVRQGPEMQVALRTDARCTYLHRLISMENPSQDGWGFLYLYGWAQLGATQEKAMSK